MKKILIHTLVAATLTAGLSGCGDSFLETKFYKGQDIEKGLTSVPIVDAALNGAYDNFYNYRFAGNYALAIGDVSTDIAYWNGVTGHWSKSLTTPRALSRMPASSTPRLRMQRRRASIVTSRKPMPCVASQG